MGEREQAEREALGTVIRRQRVSSGLSVRKLAAEVGVSASTMSAIERGTTGMTADRLYEVSRALGTTAQAIRRGENAHPATAPTATPHSREPWRQFSPITMDPAMRGAIEAFVDLGYHGAGMRMIADRAGISVPGLYHHYPSKQALLLAILDLTMKDLLWRIEAALAHARQTSETPAERLRTVVEVLALFHAARRDLAFLGASEMRSLNSANRLRIARVRTRVQHILDGEIEACARRGLVDVDDVAEAGRAIATMCTSICQWFRPTGDITPTRLASDYAGFALRLVGAQRPLPAKDSSNLPRT